MIKQREIDLKAGLTGRGTRALSEDEVVKILDCCAGQRIAVRSMEAHRIDKDGDLPMIEHSILGLEEESVWGAHDNQKISFDLVKKKLMTARSETNPMRFQLWFRGF